ncbi:MAG: WYL domain-containing protein [Clostridiales bacterium]|nr:WYL domain-containing protein [Clostridiales bacterium]
MPLDSNKKLYIMYILKVLREESDEKHPLRQLDIINKVKSRYNVDNIDRKTIARTIDSLIDMGVDIVKLEGGGCYLADRELEPSEITFLIDAIFSSRALNCKQAKDLSDKLSKLLSVHQRNRFKYVHKSDEVVRTDNKQLFLNIDMISEAIEKGKQISFNYTRHYFDKNKNAEQEEKEYIINPYFMVNNQGKYYLVCNYDYYNDVANYKIEQIRNVKILDTDIKPITKLKDCENGLDKAKFINENIYMFNNQTVSAVIKVGDEYAVNYIVDWFGKDARLYSKDGDILASVRVNEQALIYWCLQYGESVELVSPETTREKIKDIVKILYKKYQ